MRSMSRGHILCKEGIVTFSLCRKGRCGGLCLPIRMASWPRAPQLLSAVPTSVQSSSPAFFLRTSSPVVHTDSHVAVHGVDGVCRQRTPKSLADAPTPQGAASALHSSWWEGSICYKTHGEPGRCHRVVHRAQSLPFLFR